MKFVMIALSLVFAQAAMAGSPKIFTGKFTTNSELCDTFRGPSRVYVTLDKDWNGNPLIQFYFYGDDSAMAEVLLDSGARQAPGTSEETHGKVIQSWETYFESPQHLVSEVNVKSDRGHYFERFELTLRADRLTYREVQSDGTERVCKMDRAN